MSHGSMWNLAALFSACLPDFVHAFETQAAECSSRSLLQMISSPSAPSALSEHALHGQFSALQANARGRGIAVDLGQSMGDALIGLSSGEPAAEELDAQKETSGGAAATLRLQLQLPITPEDIQTSDLGPLPKFLKGLHGALRAAAHGSLSQGVVNGTRRHTDQLIFRSIRGSYLQLNTSDDGSVNTSDTPAGNATLLHTGMLLENRMHDGISSQASERTTVELEVSRADAAQPSAACAVYNALLQALNDRQGSTLVTVGSDTCEKHAAAATQQSTAQVVLFAILRFVVICILGFIAFRSINPQKIQEIA